MPQQIARTASRWTSPSALAAYLGLRTETVRRWIKLGALPAARVDCRHYSDERTRKTLRRRYRIYEDDVKRLLQQWRAGTRAPSSLWE